MIDGWIGMSVCVRAYVLVGKSLMVSVTTPAVRAIIGVR